ncbi:MAG: PEP-CTERM sorting domain-containing protein [Okeania sp. SIO3I5]|uniref:PEP-CTERM sorting domain-containing protein n=1 Tax=Okeania sp. SIO3I5 TaxID=2607805 RepID=UPI0013BB8B9F|nr:PEP-CTERM sorting domain-containing protein [Okeania sp. SIO3I5]NEQ40082.1 PEP-CTERM sorting domain-containing protein [Okeania sp. SIO3I5]
MTNIFQKLSFVATSAILGLTVINANPVNAASITYDFEVNNLDGFLAGETYSGFLEFDDSNLLVSQFSFDFEGVNYTEADLIDPEVLFDDQFLGLISDVIDTDVEFSFLEAVPEIDEPATFIYFIDGQEAGGDITYTLRQESPVSTPEPTAVFSLLALGAVGSSGILKKRK